MKKLLYVSVNSKHEEVSASKTVDIESVGREETMMRAFEDIDRVIRKISKRELLKV